MDAGGSTMGESLTRYYQMLELDIDADEEEIERAYNDLVKKWAPDNFVHDLKMQAQAYEKLKELRWARDGLVQHLSKNREQTKEGKGSTTEGSAGRQRDGSADSPAVNQPSPPAQGGYLAVSFLILSLILELLDFSFHSTYRFVAWFYLPGVVLAATGLVMTARRTNRGAFRWSLWAILPVFGPLVGLIITIRGKKGSPAKEPLSETLRFGSITIRRSVVKGLSYTLIAALLIVVFVPPIIYMGKADVGARQYRRGLELLNTGNYAGAIDDFTSSDKNQGESMRLYRVFTDRGWAYLKLGKHEEAIKDFNRTIGSSPEADLLDRNYDLLLAYSGRGVAYARLGNHQQALEDLNRSMEKLSPNEERYPLDFFAETHYGLGVACAGVGNYQESIEHYRVAARRGHNEAKNYLKSKNIDW
jgi:hypothetical protein